MMSTANSSSVLGMGGEAAAGGSSGSGSTNSPSSQQAQQRDQSRRLKLNELVRPIFQESYFTAEYCLLGAVQVNQPNKLSGLYAIPSSQSPFVWFAVLFVHSGPWQGGIFRFVVRFPDNFPDATTQSNLPTIHFTGAYPKCHPLINPARGNFDIRRYYKTYSRSSHHIWQLLKCTRKIFYKLDIADKVTYPNKSAAELYLKSQEQFYQKCDTDVQNSVAKVYEDDIYSTDANYIRFSKDQKLQSVVVSQGAAAGSTSSIATSISLPSLQSSGIGMSWMSMKK